MFAGRQAAFAGILGLAFLVCLFSAGGGQAAPEQAIGLLPQWQDGVNFPAGWSVQNPEMVSMRNVQGRGTCVTVDKTILDTDLRLERYFEPFYGQFQIQVSLAFAENQSEKSLSFGPEARREDGGLVFGLLFQNGSVYAAAGQEQQRLFPYTPGQWYDVSIAVDLEADLFCVYIDGEQRGNPMVIRNAVNNIGWVGLQSNAGGMGAVDMAGLRFSYAGFEPIQAPPEPRPFLADFETDIPGLPPAGWTVEALAPGLVWVAEDAAGKCLYMGKDAQQSAASMTVIKELPEPLEGLVDISFRLKMDAATWDWKSIIFANHRIQLVFTGNTMLVYDNQTNTAKTAAEGLEPGKWHEILLKTDTVNGKFDVWVNGSLRLADVEFNGGSADISSIIIPWDSGTAGGYFLDDIRIVQNGQAAMEIRRVEGYDSQAVTNAPAMWDWMEQFQPVPGGIVYTAEEMELSGYVLCSDGRGNYAKAVKSPAEARLRFQGADGYYRIHIGYLERPGEFDSVYTLYHNGVQLDRWYGQFDDGRTHVRWAADCINVHHGDIFTVNGYAGADPSLLKYVEFIEAEPAADRTGTLVQDRFWTPLGFIPSGWRVDERGGLARMLSTEHKLTLRACGNEGITVVRQFPPQHKNRLSVNFRFRLREQAEGVSFSIGGQEKTVFRLIAKDGGLYLADTPYAVLDCVQPNLEYTVTAELDLEKRTAVCGGYTVPLLENVEFVDRFRTAVPAGQVSIMEITYFEAVAGYMLQENFGAYNDGAQPETWQMDAPAGRIAVMEHGGAEEKEAMGLAFLGGEKPVSAKKAFPPADGPYTVRYQIYADEFVDGIYQALQAGDRELVRLYTRDGRLYCQDVQIWTGLKPGLWYDIQLAVNPEARSARIWVNQCLTAEAVPVNGGEADTIVFGTSPGLPGKMILDSVWIENRVYRSPVPEPVPAKNEYIVGVQACDLWGEGEHFGWDTIRPYDNRTPFLGYYDQNSLAAAEWQIKWMLEHGINHYMTCWFRPAYGRVSTPQNGGALEAMLYSPYFQDMTFSLLFENAGTGVTGAADFRENIVRYWIEHYFKHPSYLQWENQPVVMIYDAEALIRQLGGVSENAKVFDEVRQMMQEEGFDGIIFMARYIGSSQQAQERLRAAGYAYTSGYSGSMPVMENQLAAFADHQAAGVLPAVGYIHQGWGPEAWGLFTRKTNVGLNDWQKGMQWLKSYYMPQYDSGSLASRFILLGNWNEFGEGHMIAPGKLAGFGYLDCVRSVFTPDMPHIDVLPSGR